MTYLGYKIPVPPKRDNKKWEEIRKQVLVRKTYSDVTESERYKDRLESCIEEIKVLRTSTPSPYRKKRILELQQERERLRRLIKSSFD